MSVPATPAPFLIRCRCGEEDAARRRDSDLLLWALTERAPIDTWFAVNASDSFRTACGEPSLGQMLDMSSSRLVAAVALLASRAPGGHNDQARLTALLPADGKARSVRYGGVTGRTSSGGMDGGKLIWIQRSSILPQLDVCATVSDQLAARAPMDYAPWVGRLRAASADFEAWRASRQPGSEEEDQMDSVAADVSCHPAPPRSCDPREAIRNP